MHVLRVCLSCHKSMICRYFLPHRPHLLPCRGPDEVPIIDVIRLESVHPWSTPPVNVSDSPSPLPPSRPPAPSPLMAFAAALASRAPGGGGGASRKRPASVFETDVVYAADPLWGAYQIQGSSVINGCLVPEMNAHALERSELMCAPGTFKKGLNPDHLTLQVLF